jgi:uncharacterized protein (DUF924 family)
MHDATADGILDFWLEEVGPKGWYQPTEALDDTVRERYGAMWEAARAGRNDHWAIDPSCALALVILLDQFPRNMFRGDARAFATDPRARRAAKRAIALGHPQRVGPSGRQFLYMPLMHSEILADQNRCVRLFALSFGPGELSNHARAHREIIRRFGRFPFRNTALGRPTTPEEQAWLDAGGYASTLAELDA